ncbi:MAG: sulfurtransferase complex subunit TusB [Promethearchaeota archaeon]|nr:MAG: sulfurtransferase complex subunit TusB [Candidatus Lokiarchaeota archaeon]
MESFTDLYLFGFSSRNSVHLERLYPILKQQGDQDSKIGLVLIHDGVIGTTKYGVIPKPMEAVINLSLKVFAMEPDLKARGIPLEQIHDKITVISYDKLVDIMNNSEKLISWM